MAYDVLDVCRYIINYSNEKDYGISNLKLQKVLYFVQAYFLITRPGKPCFLERIEAWDFGPVIPKAYCSYNQYGGGDIPTIRSYVESPDNRPWDVRRISYDASVISKKDRARISRVVDGLADFSATDLVSLTMHQPPWQKAYVPLHTNEISRESVKACFDQKEKNGTTIKLKRKGGKVCDVKKKHSI